MRGANTIGMQRAGIEPETVSRVKRAIYAIFLSDKESSAEAWRRIDAEHGGRPAASASCSQSVRASQAGRQGRAAEMPRRSMQVSGPGELRAAVIGVGAFGRHHARIFHEMEAEGVRLVGLVDVDPEGPRDLAARLRRAARAAPSTRLPEPVDVVSVAVPTVDHRRVAEPLLERGVHCLVEKPIAGAGPTPRRWSAAARRGRGRARRSVSSSASTRCVPHWTGWGLRPRSSRCTAWRRSAAARRTSAS